MRSRGCVFLEQGMTGSGGLHLRRHMHNREKDGSSRPGRNRRPIEGTAAGEKEEVPRRNRISVTSQIGHAAGTPRLPIPVAAGSLSTQAWPGRGIPASRLIGRQSRNSIGRKSLMQRRQTVQSWVPGKVRRVISTGFAFSSSSSSRKRSKNWSSVPMAR